MMKEMYTRLRVAFNILFTGGRGENMVAIYIALLAEQRAGILTIDNVPALWRDEVRAELEKTNAKLD